ncbi:MAG: gliding motility-associated C-terminal domain-containing protein [Chitinophagales bacterium]|nr:gliding motility-associated C-terminal domain-containing protein [Chitinophagales bacterium]
MKTLHFLPLLSVLYLLIAISTNKQTSSPNTSAPGYLNVCLEAGNGLCTDISCISVAVNQLIINDCDNTFAEYLETTNDQRTGAITIAKSEDGNLFVGGYIEDQAMITKIDINGDIIWSRAIDFTDRPDHIVHLFQDPTSGDLVGTSFANNVSAGYAGRGAIAFRYNPISNQIVWINYFNTTGIFDRIKLNPATGNFIAHGVAIVNTGENNASIAELDRNTGEVIWRKQYDRGSSDRFWDIEFFNNDIYVIGRSTFDQNQNKMRVSLTKMDLQGEVDWSNYYLSSSSTIARTYGSGLEIDETGVTSSYWGNLNSTSLTSGASSGVIRTDLGGNIVWAKNYSLAGYNAFRFYDIQTYEDGYLIYGFTNATDKNLLLIKTDNQGNPIWGYSYGNNTNQEDTYSWGGSQAITLDGKIFFVGRAITNTNGEKSLLIKANADGTLNQNCDYFNELEISTSTIENPFSSPFILSEYTDNSIQPEVYQLPVTNQSLVNSFVCMPEICEICDNNIDDDNDGLIDCDDNDCPCYADCGNTYIKAMGQSQQSESLSTIMQASNGLLYAGGNHQNEGLLITMTTDGNILSQQTFNITNRQDRILSLIEDDEGYIIGTGFGQSGGVERSGFVFKYDPSTTEMIWINEFSPRVGLWSVAINPANGNYLAAGARTGNDGNQNAVIAEFDRNSGSYIWSKYIDIGASDAFYDIVPVGNTLFLPTRYTLYSNTNDMRAGITAMNTNGIEQWTKYYLNNPFTSARQYAFGMVHDNNGLVSVINGAPNGTALINFKSGLLRTDYAGNVEWATQYDVNGIAGELSGYGMAKTPDGYLLYGYGIAGDEDLMIIKTDKQGNALWARIYGGITDDDLLFNADNQLFQSGDYIYIVGRTRYYNNSEDALIIKARASDGSIDGDECIYTEFLDVATTLILNPLEENLNVSELNFTDVTNQVNPLTGDILNLECDILCEGNTYDLTNIFHDLSCQGDSIEFEFQICNIGQDTVMADIPYTIYDDDPTVSASAGIINSSILAAFITPGSCINLNATLSNSVGNIYLMINNDGSLPLPLDLESDFPLTSLIECDYINNIDSAVYELPTPSIDLGPDTTICENGVFYLDAGPDFESYVWQDGSTASNYTAFEAGTYWVIGTTLCGHVSSDTINIILEDEVLITLGQDTTICSGTSVLLSTLDDPSYTYEWSPSNTLNCNNCPAVIASPTTTTTYELVVSNAYGCVSLDSLTVNVEDCMTGLDTTLCLGDSILIEGQVVYANTMDTLILMNGSELIVNVTGLDTFYMAIDLGICLGDSVEYHGDIYLPGDTNTLFYTSSEGCDSTINITALALDTFYTVIDTTICAGSNLEYGGTTLLPGDLQEFNFIASNGCDSTVLINVLPLDTFFITIDTAICYGNSINYNGAILEPGDTQSFSFTAANGCDSTVLMNVAPLDTFFITIDTTVCYGNSINYNGAILEPGDAQTFSFTAANGCDSTVLINVGQLDTALSVLEVETCFEEPYLYNGQELAPNSTSTFIFSTSEGCDSTVIITVVEMGDIQTYETLQACEGETVDIFGIPTSETGLYSETSSSYGGCDSTHNIYLVVVDTAILNIPDGGLHCGSKSGELTVEVEGGSPPFQFQWSNGQTGQTATDLGIGQYYVTVTGAFGCQSVGIGTVYDVIPLTGADVDALSVSCYGEDDGAITVFNANGGSPPYEYSLDGINYQSENLFANLIAGEYTVYLRDSKQCDTSFTLFIEEPEPIIVELPQDITIHLGDSVRLHPSILSGKPAFFNWEPSRWLDCPDCLYVTAMPSTSTSYTLIARDSTGCQGQNDIRVFVDKKARVYIPNAFSPNGDGKNDIFKVYTASEVKQIKTFQIFNRWGGLVYQADNFFHNRQEIGWDGTHKGQTLNPGIFVYIIEVILIDDRTERYQGEIHLVR